MSQVCVAAPDRAPASVGASLRRAVDLAVGIDGRIAPVGRDLVVQIHLRAAPVPHRHDDVALDALRALRLRRTAARRRRCGRSSRRTASSARWVSSRPMLRDHAARSPGRTGCAAPRPRTSSIERRRAPSGSCASPCCRSGGRRRSRSVLMPCEPLALAPHRRSACRCRCGPVPGNSLFVGNLEHRVPVDRRIVLAPPRRRSAPATAVRLSDLAGLAVDLGGVDEAIAAHPDLVIGLRQIGQHVAALVVGHHDLGELGRQVGRLGDHPDAGLRAVRRR